MTANRVHRAGSSLSSRHARRSVAVSSWPRIRTESNTLLNGIPASRCSTNQMASCCTDNGAGPLPDREVLRRRISSVTIGERRGDRADGSMIEEHAQGVFRAVRAAQPGGHAVGVE